MVWTPARPLTGILLVAWLLASPGLPGVGAQASEDPFPVFDFPLYLTADRGSIPGIPGMGSPLLLKRAAPTGTTSQVVLVNDGAAAASSNSVRPFEEWVYNEPFAEAQEVRGDMVVGAHVVTSAAVSGELVVRVFLVDLAATFVLLGSKSIPIATPPGAPAKLVWNVPLAGKVLPRNHSILLQLDGTGLDAATVVQYGSAQASSAAERFPRRVLDSDGDGAADSHERDRGTDPLVADTDQDGLRDGDEARHGTDPLNPDTDADGELDGDEVLGGTDPLDPRSNSGRVPVRDSDQDGLPDLVEVLLGTDPTLADTDGDLASDGLEFLRGTDPRDTTVRPPDADRDGLPDVDEGRAGTDPTEPDTDGNGMGDCWEDFDQDGWSNCVEVQYGTDFLDPTSPRVRRTIPDADGDGLPDALEGILGSNPLQRDSDDDGYPDALELLYGTSPVSGASRPRDTDEDGLPDQDEVLAGTDPRLPDSDGDGVNDCLEDSDGDGWTNCQEAAMGTSGGVGDPALDRVVARQAEAVGLGSPPRKSPNVGIAWVFALAGWLVRRRLVAVRGGHE